MRGIHNQLISERLQNQKLHQCAITDADYERIMPRIETISRLAEIERSVYAVYDMHRCNYLLLSEEQKKIFAYNNKNTVDLEAHYKSIHPDDLQFVLETDAMVYRFYSDLTFNEKKDFKLVYNFRTKTVEGFYKHFMHQSIVLEQDINGRTWLTLVISHLLSDRVSNQMLQRRLINMKTGKLYLFNGINEAGSDIILTKRETEVLNLIARGYDSINIADKLKISINTVNNHRQNILRKTKTENTTQAMLHCKRLGII
jgi:DNA-binding CsgD family transcriptional regulator